MKTKTKAYALLLALLMFLLSIAGLGAAVTVHAGYVSLEDQVNYEFPEPVPDIKYEANPDENLTSLYYFSDYEGSKQYYNSGFVRQYVNSNQYITDSELYYSVDYWLKYNELGGSFWEMIEDLSRAKFFNKIENAIIIFEVRDELPSAVGRFVDDVPYEEAAFVFDLLYDIFEKLKENGCKIIFISGTDEVRYRCDYNSSRNCKYHDSGHHYYEFLGFVNIHINLDCITTYLNSVFYLSEDNSGNRQSCTYIFDMRFGSYEFIYKKLIQFLTYNTEHITQPDLQYILEQTETFIYFYNYGNLYDVSGNIVERGTVYENIYDSNRAGVIGDAATASDEDIISIFDECGYQDYTMCIYMPYSEDYINYYLVPIMRDFILNKDDNALLQYNNRCGYCDINFKPMFYSEDGWLKEPGSNAWSDLVAGLPLFECDLNKMLPFVGDYWDTNIWI